LETIGEVSNSQRHKASTLAGTQNPQHTSQPAKELAFCSAWATVFRLTQLKCKTLITDRQKGERTTGGLPKYGLTLVIFGICNSTVLHIQLDIIYLSFCCYLQLQFFNHHRYRADGILIPVLRQALFVICNHFELRYKLGGQTKQKTLA